MNKWVIVVGKLLDGLIGWAVGKQLDYVVGALTRTRDDARLRESAGRLKRTG